MEEIERMANNHHPQMKMDIIRAYHFGQNLLVCGQSGAGKRLDCCVIRLKYVLATG